MEAALDLESSAFGLGGSTPLAPTKDLPAWRNGKTRCIQNAVSSDVRVRCPRPAPMYLRRRVGRVVEGAALLTRNTS